MNIGVQAGSQADGNALRWPLFNLFDAGWKFLFQAAVQGAGTSGFKNEQFLHIHGLQIVAISILIGSKAAMSASERAVPLENASVACSFHGFHRPLHDGWSRPPGCGVSPLDKSAPGARK